MSGSTSFLRALSALANAGVEFVLVGVGGINFYARDPARAFLTLDLDLLLAPVLVNLRRALQALKHEGFEFEAGGEPFVEVHDELVLQNVIRAGASLTARHDDGAQLDLMLSIAGFPYAELARDATHFVLQGVEVSVGALEKLLRSKELSARPKDLEFLRRFLAQAEEEDPGA